MKFLRMALLPAALGIAIYFYFFLKRMLTAFGAPTAKKSVRIGIAAAAALLGWLVSDISSMASIILLHLFMLSLLLHPINFAMKRIFAKRGAGVLAVWKKVYQSGAVSILLTVLLILFGYWNLHNVIRTDYRIETDKEIRTEGYRIALIADVHYGVSLTYEELLEKCREINAANPDIVILCGDIIDDSANANEMREVYRALGTLDSEFGTYYVHGNHDRPFSFMKDDYTYTEEEQIATMEENGITVLTDDVVQITDNFVLVGRNDQSSSSFGHGKRMTLDQLFATVDQEDFVLVLDHQPKEYAENGEIGTDLLLSGHTHGGQLFPLNLLMEVIPFNDGLYGLYAIDSDTAAIVTSGFAGWNFPVKTAAPAEYVIIDVVNE